MYTLYIKAKREDKSDLSSWSDLTTCFKKIQQLSFCSVRPDTGVNFFSTTHGRDPGARLRAPGGV